MKKIAFFCIPAHGHTNPMLPVASELVKRGNTVRFYSFDEFENKIKATGADFVSCNAFLGELTEKEETGLKNVSTTEMTIQDIRITLSMDAFLDEEFKTFQPDVVYADSVCFWGKLNAFLGQAERMEAQCSAGRFDKHICIQSDGFAVYEKLPQGTCGYGFRAAENIKGTENA